MSKKKRIASISLDLDNQWSYMKIHGDEGWDQYPSYLSIFVPHVLDVLDELNLKITFFIVGKDTETGVMKLEIILTIMSPGYKHIATKK
jgi:Polysaccharide deacetylase